jgi:hypothetical protein
LKATPAADAWVIRIRKPRRRTAITALVLVAAVVLFVSLVFNSTKRVSLGGLSFDVPFSWNVHTQIPPTAAPGNIVALIGTLPWGNCDAYDVNCHFRERLDRHEVEVNVDIGPMSGNDLCACALDNPDAVPRTDGALVAAIHYIRVDGRPAIETEYSIDNTNYYLADGWRKWDIAPADTTSARYTLFAMWRGPGDDELLAELDHLVASIKLGPSGMAVSQPTDCGAPFPSVAPA